MPPSLLDLFLKRPSTADQVMRQAKQASLPMPFAGNVQNGQPPADNVGEVGAPTDEQRLNGQPGQMQPAPQIGAPPLPAGMGPKPSTGPMGEDVTAQFLAAMRPQQPSAPPAGGPPVPPQQPPSQMAPAPPVAAPATPPQMSPTPRGGMPAALPSPDDGRGMLRETAQALIRYGSPAQRVQGMQMLFEANQPTAEEKTTRERQRQLELIDASPADDDAKARARTIAGLGGDAGKVMEAIGFNDAGQKAALERKEKLTKYVSKRGTDTYNTSVLETVQKRAFDIIDKGTLATGMGGSVASSLPLVGRATDAGRLEETLSPMRAIIGFDRLQQMREESKTGGALGSVALQELRFLQAVQGSLDIANDPQILKENIVAIVEAQRLFSQMRALTPGIEMGDPESIEKYAGLTGLLGSLHGRVRVELDSAEIPTPQDEKGAEINRRYGL